MTLADIKVGDVVERIGLGKPMELIVTELNNHIISCGGRNGWNFNVNTGYEIDEDLGWDGITKSGTFIRPKENAEDNNKEA